MNILWKELKRVEFVNYRVINLLGWRSGGEVLIEYSWSQLLCKMCKMFLSINKNKCIEKKKKKVKRKKGTIYEAR